MILQSEYASQRRARAIDAAVYGQRSDGVMMASAWPRAQRIAGVSSTERQRGASLARLFRTTQVTLHCSGRD